VSTYDSADLLGRFNALAARPSSDEYTDADKYSLLATGQMKVLEEIAIRYPDCLYQAPTAMSTADSGATFTFGTDGNGYAVMPYGHVGIYSSLNSIPDNPWVPGIDYLDEGTLIRMPNGRTYSGTLYWRGIATPADIAAGTQPSLRPAPARVLIVYKAVEEFGLRGGLQPEVTTAAQALWAREFPTWMANWRTHFRNGGVFAYTNYDLAVLRNGGLP
jgi:hypothetical protein